MRNLMQKFAVFMQGRYGTDKLNNCLFVLFLVLWFVNIFVFAPIPTLIIDAFEIAIIVITVFRSLSRNISKRSAENRAFMPVYNAVAGWFKLTYKKIRDRKEYRYLKCPICKAQLRVRNVKGKRKILVMARASSGSSTL